MTTPRSTRQRARWRTICVLALALAACTSVDPTLDADHVQRDLASRLGVDVPAGSIADPDPEFAAEVRELLAAPLSEASAMRVALLNNRDVRAGYERLGVARADLVQAGLLRNPVFAAESLFLLDGGTELGAGLAQSFLDLFDRPLRQRRAAHELDAAKIELTTQLVQLAFDSRRALTRLRAAQQMVDLQRQALVVAEAEHELTKDLRAAGNVAEHPVALARLAETRARLDLAAAEQTAQQARVLLDALLGLWGDQTRWTVEEILGDDPLVGVELDRVEARAVAASLALSEHRARLNALAQAVGLASWRAAFPEAEVGISAKRETNGDWGLGPGLALELPLFDRGQAKRARAGAELRSGVQRYVQLAVEVRSAARQHRDRLHAFAERVRFLRETHLPASAAALNTTLQNYNAMQVGVFEVLQQKRQLLSDQREFLSTLLGAHGARLDLQQVLAGSVPTNATDTAGSSLAHAAPRGEGA